MSDKGRKNHVVQLLDDIAVESITASEQELRDNLTDAGVDPDRELQKFKAIGQQVVARVRRKRVESLPDAVPEDPAAMRALLDRLLAMPGAPAEEFTLAYRDSKGKSNNDLRLLTSHLLELMKREHEG